MSYVWFTCDPWTRYTPIYLEGIQPLCLHFTRISLGISIWCNCKKVLGVTKFHVWSRMVPCGRIQNDFPRMTTRNSLVSWCNARITVISHCSSITSLLLTCNTMPVHEIVKLAKAAYHQRDQYESWHNHIACLSASAKYIQQ